MVRSFRTIAALLVPAVAACIQTQSFNGDGTGGGASEDHCKVQGDVVVRHLGYDTECYSTTETCDALNTCPDGYSCDGGKCRCQDDFLCGIACTGEAGCPDAYLACDVAAGICRPVLSCFSSEACPPGNVCMPSAGEFAKTCMPLGGKGTGEHCATSEECASGACVGGSEPSVCVPACEKSSDCPSGLTCAFVPVRTQSDVDFLQNNWSTTVGNYGLGCVAVAQCTGCGADTYCGQDGGCAVTCSTFADCPGSGCEVSHWGNRCTEAAPACAPSEAFLRSDSAHPGVSGYCITYTPCWGDAACAAPYTCVNVNDVNSDAAVAMSGTPSLCARVAP